MAAKTVIRAQNTVINNFSNNTCYRWIDSPIDTSSSTVKDPATGLRIDGFDVAYGRAGIRLGGDANDIEIRNGTLACRGVNTGSDLPVGIDIMGTVHNVLIENVSSDHNQMVYIEGKYTNGDGFSQESQVYNVTYRNTRSTNNSDGGYDLKGHAILEDTVADNNGRNYRFWNTIEAKSIKSLNPRGAHVWFNGKVEQNVVIDHLIVDSTTKAAIFRKENNLAKLNLTVNKMTINVPEGTLLFWGRKSTDSITLPDYVKTDANGFAINCEPPAPPAPPEEVRGFDLGEVLNDSDGDGVIQLTTATTIARLNAYLKEHGSTVVLKKYDKIRSVQGTYYELV